jgi:hypothetical protein
VTVRIEVSDAERVAGELVDERFAAARDAMLADGFVVLDDLIPADVIDALADRMHSDIPELVRVSEGRRPFPGQLQHPTPAEHEHLYRDVLANPIALGLLRSFFGDEIRTVIYTANTNMPGSVRQHVHCDLVQLQPDLDPVPRTPYAAIVNFSLIDTTPDNAVELWPGSHLDGRTHARDGKHREIPEEWVDARRAACPPIQVAQRKGSVLLRDVRVWHAGVPNTGSQPRVMVAVGYAPSWYSGFMLPVPGTVADALDTFGVPAAVRL